MVLFRQNQENMLSFYFNRSIQLENILMKKYELVRKLIRDKTLKDMIDDFNKNSREHIEDLNDKMKRLGIQ